MRGFRHEDEDSISTTEVDDEAWEDSHNTIRLPNLLSVPPSLPIPIPRSKTTHPGLSPTEEASVKLAERHYELATWSMYDRITRYRAENPVPHSYCGNLGITPTLTCYNHYRPSQDVFSSRLNPEIAYYEMDEEEIFDMEM